MKTHPDQLTAEEWIILRLMRRMVGTPAVFSSEFANTCFFIYKIMTPSCFTSACRELQNDEAFRPDTEGKEVEE